MRIVIDLRWMRPGVAGGIENLSRSFLSELLALAPVGHWTLLVPAEVKYDFDTRHRENFRVEAFDGPGRVAAILLRGARTLVGAPPSASPGAPPDAVLSLSGYIVPDMYAYRNVLVFHDLQHEYYPQFFAPEELDERRRVFSASLRRADRIIAVSQYTRRTILERFGFPPERVAIAHEAADRRFHPDGWREADVPRVLAKYELHGGEYLLFPAHTWHHKNHQGAMETLAVLRARTGLCPSLVLTGTPKEGHPGLLDAATRLGLREQVRFLGYCPLDEMPALYRGAAALFYPSLFEGFGIPLVEAMWCRCPIVCSNATSLPEVAGDAALLADPHSPAALADALARVLTDPTLRADLVERGSRRAREFSWRRFTTEVLRSLHEVCGTPVETVSPDEAAANERAPDSPGEGRPRQARTGGQPAPHGHAATSAARDGQRGGSLATFRFHRRGRGLATLRRCEEEVRQRRPAKALVHGALALLLAPEVVFTCLVYPGLRRLVPRRLKRRLDRMADTGEEAAETLAHMEHTDAWPDGWVGPRLIVKIAAPPAAQALEVSGFLQARHLGGRAMLTVLVDGGPAGQVDLGDEPSFAVTLPFPAALAEGMHVVEIRTGAYFVPHQVLGNGDRRPLCWQLASLRFVA